MHREITIPGDPDSIPGARRELMEFLEQQGCPEDRAFEVGMAVQEALANEADYKIRVLGIRALDFEAALREWV